MGAPSASTTDPASVTKYRNHRSLPAPARSDHSSSSPSPEKNARLPRVSFDMGKGKGKARISIDRRDSPHLHSPLNHRHSTPIDIDDLPALPPPLPSSRFTPITDSTIINRASTPAPATANPRPSDSASPASRERPRTSSGFPPRSGPDYTAPSPTSGSNIPQSGLKPFENSKLKRAGDENSPRAEKRARMDNREGLIDGESQENSQESGRGVKVH